jgi:hypothetical protein
VHDLCDELGLRCQVDSKPDREAHYRNWWSIRGKGDDPAAPLTSAVVRIPQHVFEIL